MFDLLMLSIQWPFQDATHPRIRVDFILASEALLRPTERLVAGGLVENAEVDISELTGGMSDHYPVYGGLRDALGREFDLYRR